MTTPPCPCGSGNLLAQCCGRYHGGQPAPAAEALMRSRYSAYALGLIDYLVQTTLPAQQAQLDRAAIEAWSRQSTWLGLNVETCEEHPGQPPHAHVSFSVRWQDAGGEHLHRERSAFVHTNGQWFFLDPTIAIRAGRNDPCPCGSGSKFKKCCAPYF